MFSTSPYILMGTLVNECLTWLGVPFLSSTSMPTYQLPQAIMNTAWWDKANDSELLSTIIAEFKAIETNCILASFIKMD